MRTWRKPFSPTLAERAFKRHFKREIRLSLRRHSIDSSWALIDHRAAEMFARVAREIPDRGTQTAAVMAAYVAAAYKELRLPLGAGEAREVVGDAVKRFGHGVSAFSFRAMMTNASDPLATAWNWLRFSLASMCGETFSFAFDEDAKGYALTVRRCGFFALLRRFEVPEAMPIFCSWDGGFVDDIVCGAPGSSGEVTSRLANGDSCCRFSFSHPQQKDA